MTNAVESPSTMTDARFLVIGATGHVGSNIAGRLAEKGHDVTAMVRRPGAVIEDPYNGVINHVVGDLPDEMSIRKALVGVDVLISTANRIVLLPARLARMNQVLATPFSKPASNIFALMSFVASCQPRWISAEVVRRFDRTKKFAVSDCLDANCVRK